MAEYTLKPIPVWEAMQINNQEDADAWIASLTENELNYGGNSITNVRFVFDEPNNTMWLKYTISGEGWSEESGLDTDIGGYAMALKSGGNIQVGVMGVENFNLHYQPYAQPPA